MATYPYELAQDAAYQSYTSRPTEFWSLPKPVQGLNNNNNNNNVYFVCSSSTHEASDPVVLFKVKSCNVFSRTLRVWISSYLKSVLRYTVLIFDTYHPDTLYLHSKDMRVHGYFSNPKWVQNQNILENTAGKCRYCILTASMELVFNLENIRQFKEPTITIAILRPCDTLLNRQMLKHMSHQFLSVSVPPLRT